jgi:hypothetical protein
MMNDERKKFRAAFIVHRSSTSAVHRSSFILHHSASKLSAMLKWAMRIVAVGGALLAMAVGTAAWMHRTEGREWIVATPKILSAASVSPQYVHCIGWLRREPCPYATWPDGVNGLFSRDWNDATTEWILKGHMHECDFGIKWNGFGIIRGINIRSYSMPSVTYSMPSVTYSMPSVTEVVCPTWAVIAVLLLPMGLWAGIGWRQRRRVKAGHCANCGYDLRATPEKCPECGTAVKRNAE